MKYAHKFSVRSCIRYKMNMRCILIAWIYTYIYIELYLYSLIILPTYPGQYFEHDDRRSPTIHISWATFVGSVLFALLDFIYIIDVVAVVTSRPWQTSMIVCYSTDKTMWRQLGLHMVLFATRAWNAQPVRQLYAIICEPISCQHRSASEWEVGSTVHPRVWRQTGDYMVADITGLSKH